jgi:hypothetical protein
LVVEQVIGRGSLANMHVINSGQGLYVIVKHFRRNIRGDSPLKHTSVCITTAQYWMALLGNVKMLDLGQIADNALADAKEAAENAQRGNSETFNSSKDLANTVFKILKN